MNFPGMLTTKMTTFWLASLVAVAFVVSLTAVVSFIQMSYELQEQKVSELEVMLSKHYQLQDNAALQQGSAAWLSPLLKAYRAKSFTLTRAGDVIFEYQTPRIEAKGVHYQRLLSAPDQISMDLVLPAPFSKQRLHTSELLLLLCGLIAIFVIVRFGFRWLTLQLNGVEQIVSRCQLILSGKHDQALKEFANTDPKIINKTLTTMLLERESVIKERAQFDQFIRSNTFLDPETGIGNQLFFKNRLKALCNEQGMVVAGGMYLLELEIDARLPSEKQVISKEALTQIVNAITQLLKGQANTIFARRSAFQFAIVIPQISQAESDQLAARLLKVCLRQIDQVPDHLITACYIGGAYFKAGYDKNLLIEEAAMALRSAQFQDGSNCFMYDKGLVEEEFGKGAVRWRSFLDNVIANKHIQVYVQPIVDSDKAVSYMDISARLNDGQGQLVRESLFLPMAIKCGKTAQIDKQVIEAVVNDILPKPQYEGLFFNIKVSLDSLLNQSFVEWLEVTLLEHESLTPRLIFEITENNLVNQRECLNPIIQRINAAKAKICVGFVGQQVLSTDYLQDYDIDFIKLHPFIIRQIHLRPENQLVVRSLLGQVYQTDIHIFAERVESLEEWQTLQILGVSAAQGSFFSEPRLA